MRLFVALDIDSAIRERLSELVRRLKPQAPGLRFVGPETYHVTLKFLGETNKVTEIRERLRTVRAPGFALAFRGAGFFPNVHAPRVFWAGIQAGAELAALAHAVDEAVAPLGFERERGSFQAHITLARNGSGNPRSRRADRDPAPFQHMAQILASEPAPEFGTMAAREFFLYESNLSPAGASYSKLERYALD